MTGQRIADDGTLEAGPEAPVQVIHHWIGKFSNGTRQLFNLDPKFRRVEIEGVFTRSDLFFPPWANQPQHGNLYPIWIKSDNTIVDWNQDIQQTPKWWSWQNNNTIVHAHGEFLRMDDAAAPYWLGEVQSTVRKRNSGTESIESLTGTMTLTLDGVKQFGIGTGSVQGIEGAVHVVGYL